MDLSKIAVTVYDVFGYLLPGYVVLFALSLVESTFGGNGSSQDEPPASCTGGGDAAEGVVEDVGPELLRNSDGPRGAEATAGWVAAPFDPVSDVAALGELCFQAAQHRCFRHC